MLRSDGAGDSLEAQHDGISAAEPAAIAAEDASTAAMAAAATSDGSKGDAIRSTSGAETVLDLLCGGATVLTVGVAARSGKLLLRLGPGSADESALDQSAFTKQVCILTELLPALFHLPFSNPI